MKKTPDDRIVMPFTANTILKVRSGTSPTANTVQVRGPVANVATTTGSGNVTPVWQFPGQPANSTMCQRNLETGDPVEVLPNPTVAISLTEGTNTLTFHPQTEALLQWFEMGATSNAVDGAFSYPDETALTASAVPCP